MLLKLLNWIGYRSSKNWKSELLSLVLATVFCTFYNMDSTCFNTKTIWKLCKLWWQQWTIGSALMVELMCRSKWPNLFTPSGLENIFPYTNYSSALNFSDSVWFKLITWRNSDYPRRDTISPWCPSAENTRMPSSHPWKFFCKQARFVDTNELKLY